MEKKKDSDKPEKDEKPKKDDKAKDETPKKADDASPSKSPRASAASGGELDSVDALKKFCTEKELHFGKRTPFFFCCDIVRCSCFG